MTKATAFGDFGDGPPDELTVFIVRLFDVTNAPRRLEGSFWYTREVEVHATSSVEAGEAAAAANPGWRVEDVKHFTRGRAHIVSRNNRWTAI